MEREMFVLRQRNKMLQSEIAYLWLTNLWLMMQVVAALVLCAVISENLGAKVFLVSAVLLNMLFIFPVVLNRRYYYDEEREI